MKRKYLLIAFASILFCFFNVNAQKNAIPSSYFLLYSEKQFLNFCLVNELKTKREQNQYKRRYYIVENIDTSYIYGVGVLFNQKRICTHSAVNYDYIYLQAMLNELNNKGMSFQHYAWILDSNIGDEIHIIARLEYFSNYFRITYTIPRLDN